IFPWVKGEYAIGVVPQTSNQLQEGVRPDWLFVAQDTEPETGHSALQHLDTLARQQGLGVGPLSVEDQQILTWTKLAASPDNTRPQASLKLLQAQVVGAHTQVNSYRIFASSVAAVGEALKAPQNSLSVTSNFQKAIAPLPLPNNGYVYLDWPKTRPLLEQQFPILRVIEGAAQPFFNHLHSLAFSSYNTKTNVQRSKLFIRLT
ncbi:MAG TPA: DUF3352 domain-containing protein, partial [Candidatus Caenarcaniphilales bacterium]